MFSAILLLFSCNISKVRKLTDPQLVKNNVKVLGTEKGRFLQTDLESQIKQKPNKKFLGLRLSVTIYRWRNKQNDSSNVNIIQKEYGVAPIKLDSSLIESSIKSIKNYLRSKGYYYPEVNFEVLEGQILKGRFKVNYIVTPNKSYNYGKYNVHAADKKIYELLNATLDNSLIKIGHQLDREELLNEQVRITTLLRNNGYLLFSKEFIDFEVDTTLGNFYVGLSLHVKNKNDYELHKQFTIKDITIEIETGEKDKNNNAKDSLFYKGFGYKPNGINLNPEILSKMIFLKSGEMFQQTKLAKTYNHFSDLQMLRMVNIIPFPEENDTINYVDFKTTLKLLKKYDFFVEPQLTTSDQGNLLTGASYRNYGGAGIIQFSNRNIFHNAEIFQLRFRASIEAQRGENVPSVPFFNSNEFGLSASIIFPQLLFLNKLERKLNNATSKTILNTSVIYEKNIDYERRVLIIGSSYQISIKSINLYVAFPEFSYIRTNLTSNLLENRSKNDIFLQNLFANNLIINDIRLGFVYNNQGQTKNKNYIFLRWDALDLAGNIVTGFKELFGAKKNDAGRYQLMGINYFQYAKSYIDFRYYHTLDENNSMVYRVAFGYGLPYGNSPDFVPFEKRFFIGGANSIRAFIPRSIGPGTYNDSNQIDHSGEIKLELNYEYRFNIFKHVIEGAIFTDAGNVWTARATEQKGANFEFSKFYNELAIGSGVGVRLNFNIFLFRLDAAFPIHNPSLPENKRWVINEYSGANWIWDFGLLNFGVGYPF